MNDRQTWMFREGEYYVKQGWARGSKFKDPRILFHELQEYFIIINFYLFKYYIMFDQIEVYNIKIVL